MTLPVAAHNFSKAFLDEIGAPPNTTKLTFEVETGQLLNCTAVYYTGESDPLGWLTGTKRWEVRLAEGSLFRKLIEGTL